jgi:hypothetical protein
VRASLARYPLEPASVVSVQNLQGDITVEAWERAEAEVAVVKTPLGSLANPDEVHLEVRASERSLTLRTLYPRHSEAPVRVDYRLRVPRQVRLVPLRTVVGNIRVRGTEGSLDARTLNGNIQNVDVTGEVVSRSLNGNIALSLRALPEGLASVRLETVNGHIWLALPPEPNADLNVSTVDGGVQANYAFTASEIPGDVTLKTRLGRGGTRIDLRTVRGNIHVTEQENLL